MAGSSSQYCSRSLPETSARLPTEAKEETPSPRRCAASSSATPIAPDWQKIPNRPAIGSAGASEALSGCSGAVLTRPNAFGPITRIPAARAWRTSARCRSRPSEPVSAYPAVTTTSPCTPCAPHSATTAGTACTGTATTARSTGPGISSTERCTGTPSSSVPGGAALFTA